MAGLPPGDPQLVSMIVNHLKTQGLFDQFRRDCLADVDTKPAYLNLKQRVDNFVSNHLSNHTWSPHLNKNQLRNNIRQLVLQSGMLEQGVDRIVAQVVDPKVNHIFRPQVERVVREFLSPGSCSEEPPAPPPLPPPPPPAETSPDDSPPEQASSSTAAPSSDAMSILDTISTLNQEANVRSNTASDKGYKSQISDDATQSFENGEQEMVVVEQGESQNDRKLPEDEDSAKSTADAPVVDLKTEDSQEPMDIEKDGEIKEVKLEEKEIGVQQQMEKERHASKSSGKVCEEKKEDDPQKSTNQAKQKARERIKEEYSLEDSDLEGLSNISVSSVHTSDLSSFEEESEAEDQLSESSEEGELQSDDPSDTVGKKQMSGDTGDEDKEQKRRRKAYVHKPFLYSRYYSDSDDEVTVEERRKSAAKDKEERLLKRQQNRERMEEKRKQKAAQTEEQDHKRPKSRDTAELQGPRAKEARKERKVLEKKMALSRRRKLDWRKEGETSGKKKADSADGAKKTEVRTLTAKPPQPKLVRNLSDSTSTDERLRRTSGNASEDSCDPKKISDKPRTHSFILELELGSQEALKHRSVGKFDRVSRKDVHLKERKDKERSVSDERAKHKQKQEKKSEHQTDGPQQRDSGTGKGMVEEKGEKKLKVKTEKKVSGFSKDGKVGEALVEEGGTKESKKGKLQPTESVKADKDKNREKDKLKEKEKSKGEKSVNKGDSKQPLHLPSLSEERSDMAVTSDNSKKREKNSKSIVKRSKSHSEDRPGDKLKFKPEREGEKERLKTDLDKSNKLSSESEKDQRKVKTVEKGKVPEKLKSKSKDDVKSSLRMDKVQSPEARGSGSVSVNKPEAVKEKKKEDNAKEQKKVLVDSSQDKSENKSLKKKPEKKEKTSEKKDETGEDRKALKEGKQEKCEKPDRSLPSPHSVITDEPLKIKAVLQETPSDPALVTPGASTSDDSNNNISDVIPEPAKQDAEPQLYEMPEVSAEADALLTLMDVCTSAEARLPENVPQDIVPVTDLQDADMTMKEAALTLLSMDPDSTVSCDLIIPDTKDEESVESSMDTAESDQLLHVKEELVSAQAGSAATEEESSLTLHQTGDKHVDEKAEGESDGSEKEKEIKMPSIQDDTGPTTEIEGAQSTNVPDEKPLTLTENKADVDVCEPEEITAKSPPTTEPQTPAPLSEENIRQDPTEQHLVMTSVLQDNGEAQEENKAAAMDRNTCEAEGLPIEEEPIPIDKVTAEPINNSIPDQSQEVEEVESCDTQPITRVPTTGSQEEEKDTGLSEKEEQMEATDQSIPVLSSSAVSESGDEPEKMATEETTPANDPDMENSVLCTRRSSQSSEEAKEINQQSEEAEETSSNREICTEEEEAASEATAEMQKSEEGRAEESAVESPSGKAENNSKQMEESSEPHSSSLQESQVDPPSALPEGSEAAGSTQLEASTDQRKPAMKRKRSEDSAEPQDQQEEKDNSNQELTGNQAETEAASVASASCSQAPDEGKAENKADDAEGEKQQEEQEMPVKKPARRGRPPKAAAAENQEKKEQKAEEKETDGNEEEDLGEEEDEKEKATTRATTRAASRLEAERKKPSKPSTRASRQIGKDELAPATRGTRGQAAPAKGGRKRESSPPTGRTRGGQKPEEPPSKRAKR